MKKVTTLNIASVILFSGIIMMGFSCKKKGCTDPLASNYNVNAQKDDGSCEEVVMTNTNSIKTGFISSNETWFASDIYELQGKVIVQNGVTLTIEPGTIIKGQEGTGTNASALVVAKGGKISAVGTSLLPIIFTSVLDNITHGQIVGTNLDENDNGKWGGLIILGDAPISAADGDALSQIEGIPVTDTYGAFGGSNTADNSGIMSYVSIRHGGALIGAGNEINGLTLGGVGNGTVINNIEIVANLDDGIEFFGGTVNVSNLIVGFQGDDGVDIDMNYAGTVSEFIVINGNSSDEGLEVDGPEGTTYTSGLFNLMNGSVYTFGGTNANGEFKSKAQGTITNVTFGTAKIRTSYQNDCLDAKEDSYTHLTDAVPTLVFSGSQFTSVSLFTGSQDDAGLNDCTVIPADQIAAEGVMTSTAATGASVSGYEWTWCSVKGKL